MQTLILVRHGHCAGTDLSKSGILEIGRLSQELREYLKGRITAILSSPTRCVLETTAILKTAIHGNFEVCEELDSDNGEFTNRQEVEVLRRIEEKFAAYGVVILVTDAKFTDDLPTEWGNLRGFEIPRRVTPLGALRIINAETRREEFLPLQ